jgi:predicted  nucleic acid-binding Zn-ribbon protein
MVQRYNLPDDQTALVASDEGEFVAFTDYDAVSSENISLTKDLADTRRALQRTEEAGNAIAEELAEATRAREDGLAEAAKRITDLSAELAEANRQKERAWDLMKEQSELLATTEKAVASLTTDAATRLSALRRIHELCAEEMPAATPLEEKVQAFVSSLSSLSS